MSSRSQNEQCIKNKSIDNYTLQNEELQDTQQRSDTYFVKNKGVQGTAPKYTYQYAYDEEKVLPWLKECLHKTVCILSVKLYHPQNGFGRLTILEKSLDWWKRAGKKVLLFVPHYSIRQYQCRPITDYDNVAVIRYTPSFGRCGPSGTVGESRNSILYFVLKHKTYFDGNTVTIADERVCDLESGKGKPATRMKKTYGDGGWAVAKALREKLATNRMECVTKMLCKHFPEKEQLCIEYQAKEDKIKREFDLSRVRKRKNFTETEFLEDACTDVQLYRHDGGDVGHHKLSFYHEFTKHKPGITFVGYRPRKDSRSTLHWRHNSLMPQQGNEKLAQLVTFRVGAGGWNYDCFYPYTMLCEDNYWSYRWNEKNGDALCQLRYHVLSFDRPEGPTITRKPPSWESMMKMADCTLQEYMMICQSGTYDEEGGLHWTKRSKRIPLPKAGGYEAMSFLLAYLAYVMAARGMKVPLKVAKISKAIFEGGWAHKKLKPKPKIAPTWIQQISSQVEEAVPDSTLAHSVAAVRTIPKAPSAAPAAGACPTFRHIPKQIVQTWKDTALTGLKPEVKDNCKEWKTKNPGWKYTMYGNEECEEYLTTQFDDDRYLKAFQGLRPGAFKADLFRYCVLYKEGGVYVDVDTKAVMSLEELITLATGSGPEIDFIGVREANRLPGVWQGFMACAPGLQFVKDAMDRIVQNVRQKYYPPKGKDLYKILQTHRAGNQKSTMVPVLFLTGPTLLGYTLRQWGKDGNELALKGWTKRTAKNAKKPYLASNFLHKGLRIRLLELGANRKTNLVHFFRKDDVPSSHVEGENSALIAKVAEYGGETFAEDKKDEAKYHRMFDTKTVYAVGRADDESDGSDDADDSDNESEDGMVQQWAADKAAQQLRAPRERTTASLRLFQARLHELRVKKAADKAAQQLRAAQQKDADEESDGADDADYSDNEYEDGMAQQWATDKAAQQLRAAQQKDSGTEKKALPRRTTRRPVPLVYTFQVGSIYCSAGDARDRECIQVRKRFVQYKQNYLVYVRLNKDGTPRKNATIKRGNIEVSKGGEYVDQHYGHHQRIYAKFERTLSP